MSTTLMIDVGDNSRIVRKDQNGAIQNMGLEILKSKEDCTKFEGVDVQTRLLSRPKTRDMMRGKNSPPTRPGGIGGQG